MKKQIVRYLLTTKNNLLGWCVNFDNRWHIRYTMEPSALKNELQIFVVIIARPKLL